MPLIPKNNNKLNITYTLPAQTDFNINFQNDGIAGNVTNQDLSAGAINSQQDVLETNAERQSKLVKIGSFFANASSKGAIELSKSPGYLYGLGEWASTGFKANEIDRAFDNTYLNDLTRLEEATKGEVYVPQSVRDGGFFSRFASTGYWGKDMAEGAGFMLGMIGTSSLLRSLNLGAKLAKGASAVDKVDDIVLNGAKAGSKLSKVKALWSPDNLDTGINVLYNTHVEAIQEAKGTYDDVLKSTGDKDLAGREAANNYLTNGLILIGPNLILENQFFKKAKQRVGTNADVIAKRAINQTDLSKLDYGKVWAQKLLLGAASEGLWEEGMQLASEKYWSKRGDLAAKGKVVDEDEFSPWGIVKQYGEAAGTSDWWDAITAGIVLGGGGGVVSAIKESKEMNKALNGFTNSRGIKVPGLKDLGATLIKAQYSDFNSIYKKNDKGEFILNANGKKQIDEQGYNDWITSHDGLQLAALFKEINKEKGNETIDSILDNNVWFGQFKQYYDIEGGSELLKKVISNKFTDETADVLEQVFDTKLDKSEFKNELLKKVDQFKDIYELNKREHYSNFKLSSKNKKDSLEEKAFNITANQLFYDRNAQLMYQYSLRDIRKNLKKKLQFADLGEVVDSYISEDYKKINKELLNIEKMIEESNKTLEEFNTLTYQQKIYNENLQNSTTQQTSTQDNKTDLDKDLDSLDKTVASTPSNTEPVVAEKPVATKAEAQTDMPDNIGDQLLDAIDRIEGSEAPQLAAEGSVDDMLLAKQKVQFNFLHKEFGKTTGKPFNERLDELASLHSDKPSYNKYREFLDKFIGDNVEDLKDLLTWHQIKDKEDLVEAIKDKIKKLTSNKTNTTTVIENKANVFSNINVITEFAFVNTGDQVLLSNVLLSTPKEELNDKIKFVVKPSNRDVSKNANTPTPNSNITANNPIRTDVELFVKKDDGTFVKWGFLPNANRYAYKGTVITSDNIEQLFTSETWSKEMSDSVSLLQFKGMLEKQEILRKAFETKLSTNEIIELSYNEVAEFADILPTRGEFNYKDLKSTGEKVENMPYNSIDGYYVIIENNVGVFAKDNQIVAGRDLKVTPFIIKKDKDAPSKKPSDFEPLLEKALSKLESTEGFNRLGRYLLASQLPNGEVVFNSIKAGQLSEKQIQDNIITTLIDRSNKTPKDNTNNSINEDFNKEFNTTFYLALDMGFDIKITVNTKGGITFNYNHKVLKNTEFDHGWKSKGLKPDSINTIEKLVSELNNNYNKFITEVLRDKLKLDVSNYKLNPIDTSRFREGIEITNVKNTNITTAKKIEQIEQAESSLKPSLLKNAKLAIIGRDTVIDEEKPIAKKIVKTEPVSIVKKEYKETGNIEGYVKTNGTTISSIVKLNSEYVNNTVWKVENNNGNYYISGLRDQSLSGDISSLSESLINPLFETDNLFNGKRATNIYVLKPAKIGKNDDGTFYLIEKGLIRYDNLENNTNVVEQPITNSIQEQIKVLEEQVKNSTGKAKFELNKQLIDLKNQIAKGAVDSILTSYEDLTNSPIESDVEVLQAILPDIFSVRELNTIANKLVSNKLTVGQFKDYTIYLGRNRKSTTKFHEAFHAVFRVLLTDNEIAKLIEAAKSEKTFSSSEVAIFKSLNPSRQLLSDKDLSDLMYEEYLAEKFEAYIKDREFRSGNYIKAFFKRLSDLVKRMFNNQSLIESTYRDIKKGRYRTSSERTNRFTTNKMVVDSILYGPAKEVNNGEYYFTSLSYDRSNEIVSEVMFLLKTELAKTEGDLDTKLTKAIEILTKRSDGDYYDEEYFINTDESWDRLAENYSILTNPKNYDIIYKTIKKNLDIVNFSFDESDEYNDEDFDNAEDSYGSRFDRNFENVGGISSLSKVVKEYINSIFYFEQDPNTTDPTKKVARTLNGDRVYAGMIKSLANRNSIQEILEAMDSYRLVSKDSAIFIENFFKDCDIYKDTEGKYDFRNTNNSNLFHAVIKTFNRYSVDYYHYEVDPQYDPNSALHKYGKKSRLMSLNNQGTYDIQSSKWIYNFNKVYWDLVEKADVKSTTAKKDIITLLNDFVYELSNEDTFTDAEYNAKVDEYQTKLTEVLGLELSKGIIKYSIIFNKDLSKNSTALQKFRTNFSMYEPISANDIESIKSSIDKGNNPFIKDNESIEEELNEATGNKKVLKNKQYDVINNLKRIAKSNSYFDETLLPTSFRNSKNKIVYGYQLPTFHLQRIKDLSSELFRMSFKDDSAKMRNLLLNNEYADLYLNRLKVERLSGVKPVTYDRFGQVNKLITNPDKAKVYDEYSARDLHIQKLDMFAKQTPETYLDNNGKTVTLNTSLILVRILEASSTADLVRLPVLSNLVNSETFKLSETALEYFYNMALAEIDNMRYAKENRDKLMGTDNGVPIMDNATGTPNISEARWKELELPESIGDGYLFKFSPEKGIDWKGGRAFKFFELEGLNELNLVNTILSTDELSKELEQAIKVKILDIVDKQLESYLDYLIEENIISKVDNNGTTEYEGNLLFDDFYDKEGSKFLDKVKLFESYLNDYLNIYSINNLIYGNEASLFKNYNDAVKRAKLSNAGGMDISTLNSKEFRVSVGRDVLTNKPQNDLITLKDINSTDAQGYLFDFSIRKVFEGLGKLTPAIERFITKIENGETLTVDDIFGFDGSIENQGQLISLKLVYFDGKQSYKLSTAIVTKNLIYAKDKDGNLVPRAEREQLRDLYEKAKANNIDIHTFESASKHDKMIVSKPDNLFGNSTSTKSWRLQQENPSNKKEITDPSQLLNLINLEQNRELPVYGIPGVSNIGDVIDKYDRNNARLREVLYKSAINNLFVLNNIGEEEKIKLEDIEGEDNLYKIYRQQQLNLVNSIKAGAAHVNLSEFIKQARQILELTGANNQLMEFFSLDENDVQKYNLNIPSIVDKFAQLLLSYFNNNGLKIKKPGHTGTLMSGWGINVIENDGKIISSDEYNLNSDKYPNAIFRPLKHNVEVKDKDDNVIKRYSEVLFPAHFQEIFKLKKGDIIPDELLDMLGIRIPTQDKHSMMSLRVVDFLPVEMGSTIIAPDEIIALSGADFDIDKLYMQRFDFYKNAKREIKLYGDAVTDSEKWFEYKTWMFKNNKLVKNKFNTLLESNKEYQDLLEVKKQLKNIIRENKTLNNEELTEITEYLKTAQSIDADESIIIDLKSKRRMLFNTMESLKSLKFSVDKEGNSTDTVKLHHLRFGTFYNINLPENLKGKFVSLQSITEHLDNIYSITQEQALKDVLLPYNESIYIKSVETKGESNPGVIMNELLRYQIVLLTNDGIQTAPEGETPIGLQSASLSGMKDLVDNNIYPEIQDSFKSTSTFNKSLYSHNTPVGQIESFRSIREGARGIGPAVNGEMCISIFAKHRVDLRFDIFLNGKNYNKFYDESSESPKAFATGFFPNLKDNKGKSIFREGTVRVFDSISTLVSAMTDNAKEELASKLNITLDSISPLVIMLGVGIPMPEAILILNQPAIKDYNRFKKNASNTLKTFEESKTDKKYLAKNNAKELYKVKDDTKNLEVSKESNTLVENNEIVFAEDLNSGYTERTKRNANADATIAIAVDFESAGEKLTKKSVLSQGKQYIPIDFTRLDLTLDSEVDKIVDLLNSVNAKTLNIAGNGIYTFKQKGYEETQNDLDTLVYNMLSKVINHPNLKNKIESIRTGGQTGFDEAGAKASMKLGIKTYVLAPKGWKFRNISAKDISNEEQFKSRFSISTEKSVKSTTKMTTDKLIEESKLQGEDRFTDFQRSMLDFYLDLEEVSSYMDDLVQLTKKNKGLTSDLFQFIKFNKSIERLGLNLSNEEFEESKIPFDLRYIITGKEEYQDKDNPKRVDPLLNFYYETMVELNNTVLKYFLINQAKEFKYINNTLIKNLDAGEMNSKLTDEVLGNITRDLQSYLTIQAYTKYLQDNDRVNGLTYDLIFKDRENNTDSIVDVYKKLKELYPLNQFLKYVIPNPDYLKIGDVYVTNPNNKLGINHLESSYKLDANSELEASVANDFVVLYRDNATRPLVQRLFDYILVKDGLQYKNKSIVNYIANFMFKDISNVLDSVTDIFQKEVVTEEDYQKVYAKSRAEVISEFVKLYETNQDNAFRVPSPLVKEKDQILTKLANSKEGQAIGEKEIVAFKLSGTGNSTLEINVRSAKVSEEKRDFSKEAKTKLLANIRNTFGGIFKETSDWTTNLKDNIQIRVLQFPVIIKLAKEALYEVNTLVNADGKTLTKSDINEVLASNKGVLKGLAVTYTKIVNPETLNSFNGSKYVKNFALPGKFQKPIAFRKGTKNNIIVDNTNEVDLADITVTDENKIDVNDQVEFNISPMPVKLKAVDPAQSRLTELNNLMEEVQNGQYQKAARFLDVEITDYLEGEEGINTVALLRDLKNKLQEEIKNC